MKRARAAVPKKPRKRNAPQQQVAMDRQREQQPVIRNNEQQQPENPAILEQRQQQQPEVVPILEQQQQQQPRAAPIIQHNQQPLVNAPAPAMPQQVVPIAEQPLLPRAAPILQHHQEPLLNAPAPVRPQQVVPIAEQQQQQLRAAPILEHHQQPQPNAPAPVVPQQPPEALRQLQHQVQGALVTPAWPQQYQQQQPGVASILHEQRQPRLGPILEQQHAGFAPILNQPPPDALKQVLANQMPGSLAYPAPTWPQQYHQQEYGVPLILHQQQQQSSVSPILNQQHKVSPTMEQQQAGFASILEQQQPFMNALAPVIKQQRQQPHSLHQVQELLGASFQHGLWGTLQQQQSPSNDFESMAAQMAYQQQLQLSFGAGSLKHQEYNDNYFFPEEGSFHQLKERLKRANKCLKEKRDQLHAAWRLIHQLQIQLDTIKLFIPSLQQQK